MATAHKKQLEFLKNKFELDQLSHAYLFSGSADLGKKEFAIEFVKLVNCMAKDGKPCNRCANCQMIERGSFPDLMVIDSRNENEIQIARIREVQNFLSYKSYYGLYKAAIVYDAEKMNQEAQSCFLKTLEEPKGKTLLILISSRPDMLLATIASRCQVVKFFPSKDVVKNSGKLEKEKKIFGELEGIINAGLSEKFKYVKSLDFDEQKPKEIVEVIQKYFRNLLFAETGVGKLEGQSEFLGSGAYGKKYTVEKIKSILNLSEDINNKLTFTNANPRLALEILLMEV